MAEKISLTEAAAVLKQQFGEELHTTEEEGRREMVDALKRKLNLPDAEAREMVKALEQAHSIHWMAARGTAGAIPPAGLTGSGTATPPYPAAAVPSAVAAGEGSWRFS
jgi:hypothetical protein